MHIIILRRRNHRNGKSLRKAVMFTAGIAGALMLGRVAAGMEITAERTSVSDAQISGTGEAKKVAITFDDGPNADYTEMLLEGLKERGVKATFFLLGTEVEKYPEIVKDIHDDGHLIGTHSYEHVNLGSLSDEEAVEQVNKTNRLIYELTGEYPSYIRPPYGSWKENLDSETEMFEVLWDVDPRDWATDDTLAVFNNVIPSVQENDIILLHDASESSVDAAFLIIDELQKRGYVFVTVDEIMLEP